MYPYQSTLVIIINKDVLRSQLIIELKTQSQEFPKYTALLDGTIFYF